MARRQITEAGEGNDPSDLPEITTQQMKFVEGICAGKTASDAYRAAYDCSNSSNNTIWCEASKLRSNPKVAQWLTAARTAGFASVSCSMDEHLRELARLRDVAEDKGNLGAAVQAEQLRGKVAGHYVDKVADVSLQNDAIDTLRQIAKLNPEYAASLAEQHGIEWGKPEEATAH